MKSEVVRSLKTLLMSMFAPGVSATIHWRVVVGREDVDDIGSDIDLGLMLFVFVDMLRKSMDMISCGMDCFDTYIRGAAQHLSSLCLAIALVLSIASVRIYRDRYRDRRLWTYSNVL